MTFRFQSSGTSTFSVSSCPIFIILHYWCGFIRFLIWHRVFYNFFGTEIHKRLGAIRKRLGAIHKGLGAIYKRLGAIYKKLGAKILAPKLYTPYRMSFITIIETVFTMVRRVNSWLYQHCVAACNIHPMYSHRFAQRFVRSKNLKMFYRKK